MWNGRWIGAAGRWSALAGSAIVMVGQPSAASAAELHRPLPPDSTERNGTPQTIQKHFLHSHPPPPAALAPSGLNPDAAAGLARAYSGPPIDATTYHYDAPRTGWNARETDLTPANVASASFGQLKTLNVDGNVLAEPLLVSSFTMPDGRVHDVLVVATGHNSVYGYDARSYALLWKINLGAAQSSADVGCEDVVPEYGISSTPVIVRTAPNAATLYLVAATEPAPFSFHTKLHALDLASGADMVTPAEIAPTATLANGGAISFDPQNQWSRAGLAYQNGAVYVGISSHCDHDTTDISGWLLRYDAGLHLRHAFNTIETRAGYELSSIWMSGFAPSIDSHGNVFFVTGNGAYSRQGAKNFGETALSLSETLTRVNSTFTPANWVKLNDQDTDFGSGGVMLLPPVAGQTAPPLAVVIGKDAKLFLLSQTNLGGLQPANAGALQVQSIGPSGGGVWGGPAFYGADPTGGRVYIQRDSDVLRAFRVSLGATPKLIPAGTGTSQAGFGGSLPIVSSNGQAPATAVVWLIRRGATEQLEAYDAMKLGAPIFAANAGVWSNRQSGAAFVTPLVANGRVYVPAYKTVMVFGLTN